MAFHLRPYQQTEYQTYNDLSLDSLPGEIWKPVLGYEDKYLVSNKGRVKCIKAEHYYKAPRIVKQRLNDWNYPTVHLSKTRKNEKIVTVHKIVATAFIPNPVGYCQINHKDENTTNNCVENLEWCDMKYNVNYGTRTERAGLACRLSNKTHKYIACYNNEGEIVKVFYSIAEAIREKYCTTMVNTALKDYKRTSGGYHWKYITREEYETYKL